VFIFQQSFFKEATISINILLFFPTRLLILGNIVLMQSNKLILADAVTQKKGKGNLIRVISTALIASSAHCHNTIHVLPFVLCGIDVTDV